MYPNVQIPKISKPHLLFYKVLFWLEDHTPWLFWPIICTGVIASLAAVSAIIWYFQPAPLTLGLATAVVLLLAKTLNYRYRLRIAEYDRDHFEGRWRSTLQKYQTLRIPIEDAKRLKHRSGRYAHEVDDLPVD